MSQLDTDLARELHRTRLTEKQVLPRRSRHSASRRHPVSPRTIGRMFAGLGRVGNRD